MTEPYSQGKTTVSPDVLITITRLSALSVPGVSRMAQVPGGVNRLFKRGIGDGLHSRTDRRRVTEVNVGVHALNRMLELGRPESVRIA